MTVAEARALTPGLYRLTFQDRYERDAVVSSSLPGTFYTHEDGSGWAWGPITSAVPLLTVPLTPGMSQAQQLAVAVLQGNTDAIPGLLDECEAEFHGRPSVEERIAEAVRKQLLRMRDHVETDIASARRRNQYEYADSLDELVSYIHDYTPPARTTHAPTS